MITKDNPGRGELGRLLVEQIADPHAPHDGLAAAPAAEAGLLTAFMAEFGHSETAAIEYLEWFQEHTSRFTADRDAADHQKVMFDIFSELILQPLHRTHWTLYMLLYNSELPFADQLINYETPADWHRRMGISKQMAYKLTEELRIRLNFPRRTTQRDAAARARMKRARFGPKKTA